MTRHALLSAAAFAAFAASVPASAAVRCVSTGGGACFTKIQDAIDAASENDTILIGVGAYYENLNVTKAGLKLQGASKTATILDPSPNSAVPEGLAGQGIVIAAANVSVRNLTIRNGRLNAILVSAPDATIQGVVFLGTTCNGVLLNGISGTQVLASEFRSMGCAAVASNANLPTPKTVVKLNAVYGAKDGGILITGDDSVASNNRVYHCGGSIANGDCIAVAGASAVVQANVVQGAQACGIRVAGATPLITGNRVSDTFDGSICVEGAGAVVKLNVVDSSEDDGIGIDGDGANVSNNTVTHAFDGEGISVIGNAPIVTFNRVSDALFGEGLDVEGAGAVVTSNLVANTEGAFVKGTNPKVELNRVTNSREAGLEVDCTPGCSASSVSRNAVTDTFEGANGIVVSSDLDGMVVANNAVTRAGSVSYDVNGQGIDLQHNSASDQMSDPQPCYVIRGAGGGSASFNTATRCSGAGFRVESSNNTLVHNTATSNYGNGFEVFGVTNVLTSNAAGGNIGAGFAVIGATDAGLVGNVALPTNRVSFCDDATNTTTTGNSFPIVAPTCDVQR